MYAQSPRAKTLPSSIPLTFKKPSTNSCFCLDLGSSVFSVKKDNVVIFEGVERGGKMKKWMEEKDSEKEWK